MQIRKAKVGDAKEISELVIETIEEINSNYCDSEQIKIWVKRNNPTKLAKKLRDKKRQNFVMISCGEIVGYCTQSKNKVLNLYVRHFFMREGVGKKLMEYMENNARKQFKIMTLDSSLMAYKFYQKNGYKKVKDVYSKIDGVMFQSVRIEKDLR